MMNPNKHLTQAEVIAAFEAAAAIVKSNIPEFTHQFQRSNSESNFYSGGINNQWTTGFCTGEFWLAYEHTQDEVFKTAALAHVQNFMDRIITGLAIDNHDMGFLYTPSCVAAYKLVGDETAKEAAVMAADYLITRFQTKGNFIQAWGELGAEDNYRLIIDCLLNLPLLYWASEVTGDAKYADIAKIHTKTSIANLVREDNSTYHTYFFDLATGEPTHGATRQGYRDGSAWARGQAWGVYGLALSYRYTQDESCFDLFERVTDFFIAHSPADLVAYWDMDFTDGSGEPKDSSATAIAACGMLEMAKYLPAEKAAYYTDIAYQMAAALIHGYAVKDSSQSNGLLLHGVYAKASPYNPIPQDRGVDECNTWGDYFYMELLMRLMKDWELYW